MQDMVRRYSLLLQGTRRAELAFRVGMEVPRGQISSLRARCTVRRLPGQLSAYLRWIEKGRWVAAGFRQQAG